MSYYFVVIVACSRLFLAVLKKPASAPPSLKILFFSNMYFCFFLYTLSDVLDLSSLYKNAYKKWWILGLLREHFPGMIVFLHLFAQCFWLLLKLPQCLIAPSLPLSHKNLLKTQLIDTRRAFPKLAGTSSFPIIT